MFIALNSTIILQLVDKENLGSQLNEFDSN